LKYNIGIFIVFCEKKSIVLLKLHIYFANFVLFFFPLLKCISISTRLDVTIHSHRKYKAALKLKISNEVTNILRL